VCPPFDLFISGIGLESSILFAQEGANVLLVDINLEAAEKTAKIIHQKYPNVKAIAVKADVGKEADVRDAVDTAKKEFGRLDIMVLIHLLCPSRRLILRTSSTTRASILLTWCKRLTYLVYRDHAPRR
jgi:NAD(P)-dependent dehydrogenase (short-subunit alcohol dehydrogenase family)